MQTTIISNLTGKRYAADINAEMGYIVFNIAELNLTHNILVNKKQGYAICINKRSLSNDSGSASDMMSFLERDNTMGYSVWSNKIANAIVLPTVEMACVKIREEKKDAE